MASKITVPSTGELSIIDIKDVVFGTAYSNLNLNINTLSNNSGRNPDFNDFRGYYVEVSTNINTLSFIKSANTKDVSVLSIVGGSETFSSSSNQTWCSTVDDNINDIVHVSVIENNTLDTRFAVVEIKHDDNPDCYVNVNITQTTLIVKVPVVIPVITPVVATTYNVKLEISKIGTAQDMGGNVYLKTSAGSTYDSYSMSVSSTSPVLISFDAPAGDYYLDFTDVTAYSGGSPVATSREWQESGDPNWTGGGITDTFTLSSTRYFLGTINNFL